MSFRFNWPEFDPTFYAEAKTQLETALNKEKKSKHIAGHIFVNDLNMGSKPPELEILEICELSTDYFRGIFKLTYHGDSAIELQTKIQANPLYNATTYNPPHYGNYYPLPRHRRPGMVAAAQPLVIPMLLRISHVRLNGIVVLSVSKTKGITLVFKNDPLESLQVSSTFDIVASVKTFLQQQIESQLRSFLQDTFPIVVHEFSTRHINGQQQPRQQHDLIDQQQQYYGNSPGRYFGSNDRSDSDLYSVPDLILSSSASECFSDTSSDCLSYGLQNDDSIDGSTYEKHNHTLMTTFPPQYLTTTASTSPSSLYDSSTDYEQDQLYTPPSSQFTTVTPHHDDPSDILEQERQHYYGYTKPSCNSMTIPPPTSIQFDQPITLSSTIRPHGLLQHMQHLSTSSQTLVIESKNNIDGLVHKSGITISKFNDTTRRKKTPKRRIIRWNS